MIDVAIPGHGRLALEHLVCDYNGTLARDGVLLDGVAARLTALAAKLTVHVVTGDTFGTALRSLQGLSCAVTLLPSEGQVQAKHAFVDRSGRCRQWPQRPLDARGGGAGHRRHRRRGPGR